MARTEGAARLRRGAGGALCAIALWAFTATNAVGQETLARSDGVVAKPLAAALSSPYRSIGARHLYDTFRDRVFKGRLPPLLYAIAIVDTDVDEEGRVVNAVVTREPAVAKEVMPWILGLIRQASPFPRPGVAGGAHYRDIWLVDRNYMFQLDALTEGQQ
ncbi:MAG: hypothetical protein ACM3N6_00870 [Betaproteobacteria bacterium]